VLVNEINQAPERNEVYREVDAIHDFSALARVVPAVCERFFRELLPGRMLAAVIYRRRAAPSSLHYAASDALAN